VTVGLKMSWRWLWCGSFGKTVAAKTATSAMHPVLSLFAEDVGCSSWWSHAIGS